MEAYGQGAITEESQRISIERLVIGFNRRAVVENGLVKIVDGFSGFLPGIFKSLNLAWFLQIPCMDLQLIFISIS